MRKIAISVACFSVQFLLSCTLMLEFAFVPMAMASSAHHVLSVRLFPDSSELEGQDRIRIQRRPNGPVHLSLSPRARIQVVRIDGRDHPYTFRQGRLSLAVDRGGTKPTMDLNIDYTCRFDDPAPARPLNTDNPGFGVTGTVTPSGTFILAGAGWYPRVSDTRETFDLRVDGPADTVAVTTGRLVSIDHSGKRTVTRWQVDNPLEGLSLSAGPYVVDRQTEGGLHAATFLFPENRHLSARYLNASLGYLKRYSDLFGAYPFDGFSVVENFFPTGYGFPAYTLIGGSVLRLPFIPETSLPHEIVHSWWGNGVLVDFTSGNWCEGLTSYTADYLNKERMSPDAALDHRRQALRNYASLVSSSTDFPLYRFQSRTDPVTKAVGYDKSAMVFHMLRQELGDAVFWNALRDLYHDFMFKHASWKDLQRIFERHAGRSLDVFFRQWLDRPGAPQIKLESVRREKDHQEYRTIGRLVQKKPYYDVTLNLALHTVDGPIKRTVHLSGQRSTFEISSTGKPRALIADPEYQLFRRLYPEEIPPTVNTLKSSTAIVVVIAERMGPVGRSMARHFSIAMGIEPIRMIDEADFSPADAAGQDLVFIGLPEMSTWTQLVNGNVALTANAFELTEQRFDGPSDVLFLVTRRSDGSENIVSLLHPLSAGAADQASRKIPHYGRYSYLAFSDGRNRVKGTWEVDASPMMVRWDPATTP